MAKYYRIVDSIMEDTPAFEANSRQEMADCMARDAGFEDWADYVNHSEGISIFSD